MCLSLSIDNYGHLRTNLYIYIQFLEPHFVRTIRYRTSRGKAVEYRYNIRRIQYDWVKWFFTQLYFFTLLLTPYGRYIGTWIAEDGTRAP